jgi:hypothetical protein
MTNKDLGKHLARELIKLGDLAPNLPCHRVQFMCFAGIGKPERPAGGMSESSLERFFAELLNKANAHNG